MLRTLLFATLLAVVPAAGSGQALSILHVRVVLVDAEQKPTPVPRHALLVSDNPSSAPPRKIVTALDGTVDVKLRPGLYTVESDRPVVFGGKAYQWTQMIEVFPGRDATLELTAANAEVASAPPETTTAIAPVENDPSFLLPRWQDSVVALWTPTFRASGFVVGANGLVVTSQRIIGAATSVEVQFTPTVKVAARILAMDVERDVAVLWVDPNVTGSVRPVSLECTPGAKPPVSAGQEILTIGAPLRGPKSLTPGTVSRVEPRTITADIRVDAGSIGGPVFTADGALVGITSIADETDETRRGDFRVVRIDAACDVLGSAPAKMRDAAPPSATHLPVEPARPFPLAALEDAARTRAASLMSYQMSSSDFDIAFITPVLTYTAQQRWEQSGRESRSNTGAPDPAQERMRVLTDFSNWSEYVADFPPVLLVRVTPKFVEGFWTKVARGAAQTQGASLPPMKRFKPGFSRMRVFCGAVEVTPIHPFKLERPVSESDVLYEGLYVFDPDALGPQCGTVKLVVYSEKEPGRGDTREVDPKVIQQIWQDFAPYRTTKSPANPGG